MPWRVDEVEFVLDAVGCSVLHADGMELDRDPALAFQLVVVEDLRTHLPFVERTGALEQSISECRLPVIDVGYDAEVADEVGLHGRSAKWIRLRGATS